MLQVLFVTSSGADVPLALPRPGIPSSRVCSQHSTSTRRTSPRAGASSHPVVHWCDRAGSQRCHLLDRRAGRLGASGRSSACSGTAAGDSRVNDVAGCAHDLYASNHDAWNFGNDDHHDDSAPHDDHDEARCRFGWVRAPLGKPSAQRISPLRRMEFSLEEHQFGLRPAALAPKMTAKPMAEKGRP